MVLVLEPESIGSSYMRYSYIPWWSNLLIVIVYFFALLLDLLKMLDTDQPKIIPKWFIIISNSVLLLQTARF